MARPLMTTPSLNSMADLIDTVVTEPVQFLVSVAKGEWVLQRRDGSVIPGFVVRHTGEWSFHLLAA